LKATGEGFRYCVENVEEAAKVFTKAVEDEYVDKPLKEFYSLEHLQKSIISMKDALFDADGVWGKMKGEQWTKFIDWLHDNKLLTTMV